jgi:protein pelota
MKLLSKSIVRDGSGSIKLIPEESEDLWHTYNLIREGDHITATTFRKVSRDGGTGADSERVKLKLTITIEGIDYDAAGAVIRLRGRNLTENEHIKLGAYHTIELEPHRAFTLEKDSWDMLDIDRIKQCTDPTASADLAVLLITEGLAHLCLVGSACTVTKAKIESTIPRKRGAAAAGYDKAIENFYNRCFTAVQRHVDWGIIKCLVIAGPGFAKDGFRDYLDAEAQRQEFRPLLLNKAKIVLAPASNAYTQALKEVLAAPGIAAQIKDTKSAAEVSALHDFMTTLASCPAKAFYGPGHVAAAHELGAIQTLLISDSLFRTNDVRKRKKYVKLVEEVEAVGGGRALVFSSAHSSGEQLNQLTGIAAILRFPLPELEDQEFDADAF